MMTSRPVGKEAASEIAGETTKAATSTVVRAARLVLLAAIALFLFSLLKGLVDSIDSTHIFISVAILASVLISCYLIERINKS